MMEATGSGFPKAQFIIFITEIIQENKKREKSIHETA